MVAGVYLNNGVYLPYISEKPWGNQVNENFIILSNAYDNIKIEFQQELAGKVDRNSSTPQIINSDMVVNGSWVYRDLIDGTITHALYADNALNANNASNANTALHANNADHADSADSAVYANSADNASNADHADRADSATFANSDAAGNTIHTTYLKKSDYFDNSLTHSSLLDHISNTDVHTSIIEKNAIANDINSLSDGLDSANSAIAVNTADIDDLKNTANSLSSVYVGVANTQTVTGQKTFSRAIIGNLNGNALTADKFSSDKTINLIGDVTGTASSKDDWQISTTITDIDASKIVSGVIDIDRIPQGALERLVTVADQAARYSLTKSNVQNGDIVKQLDTSVMYVVTNDNRLNKAAGYTEFSAGTAASVPWTGVTNKPSQFPPSSHTHLKAEITDFPNLATVATTGSYTDLKNRPTSLDSNPHTHTKSDITDFPNLATVATSGSYNDLRNKPSQFPPAAHTHTKSEITDFPNLATVATSGDYSDLINKPVTLDPNPHTHIKSEITDFPNLARVATSGSYNDLKNKPATFDPSPHTHTKSEITDFPNLATVATSGDYNDLRNRPTALDCNPHTHTKGEITDFPNLATVATSGDYNDLINIPPAAAVNNGALTIKRNGTDVVTFTANQRSDVSANIVVPTKVSELTNDSDYITLQQINGLYVTVSDTQTINGVKSFTNVITGSISGNAGTADKFSSAKSITLTGDVTGIGTSTDNWGISTTLKNSGVTAGSYGNNVNSIQTGTFKVPYVTVNAKGLVTNVSETSVTLPTVEEVDLSLYPYKLDSITSNGLGKWVLKNFQNTQVYPEGFNGETTTGIYHVVFEDTTLGAPPVSQYSDGILTVHGMSPASGISSYNRVLQIFNIVEDTTPLKMFIRRGKYSNNAWVWDTEWTEITENTKVTNTLNTTAKAYVTGTTSSSTNTGTQVFDTGVYLDTTAGRLTASSVKVTNSSSQGLKLGDYTIYIE